jgi:hypothetical protein
MSKCIEGEVKATEAREKVYEPHVKTSTSSTRLPPA